MCLCARVNYVKLCTSRYLDIPGGTGGGVSTPQGARDATRAPHDYRASLDELSLLICARTQPLCSRPPAS